MMEEQVKTLGKILNSARLVYETDDYTSATILYFKAAFIALDIILLKCKGKAPKDHTERFRMLEEPYPDLYEFIDKYFKIYRNTYTTTIDKAACDEVKKNVYKIIERYKI